MATTRVIRYDVIEVAIPSGTTQVQFNFPDQPQLRNARVVGIEFYNATATTATPLTGSTPMTSADAKKCFVTLMAGNLQKVNRMPIAAFNRFQDSSYPATMDMQLFDDQVISWTKSYLTFATAPATGATAAAFGIYFWIPDGEE